MATRNKSERIRRYIIEKVDEHSKHITALTAEEFGISRQAANRHIRILVGEGLLSASGKTRSMEYSLTPLIEKQVGINIVSGLSEDRVWRQVVKPEIANLAENVLSICNHGITEMMNNVIDHSEGSQAFVSITLDAAKLQLGTYDNGIGIFNKIKRDLNLEDDRHAILELSKGKLTTDPEKHSGEGIFFTSRMFDEFYIQSGNLFFIHSEPGGDWLLERREADIKGTNIHMTIRTTSSRTSEEVFDKYAGDKETYGFTRTHVPVALAKYGDENLISRSQARRLLARFDQFEEVLLDFRDVQTIGQAFADEIFRVFKNAHPRVKLLWINENDSVRKMILRATHL